MAQKHIWAISAESAKKKASGKTVVVGKVDYIKGSKKGRMKLYNVHTHKRKK